VSFCVPNPNSNGIFSLKTVFVLDDNLDSINVFRWVLERHYNVLATETAADAIALCRQHREHLNLIVADVPLQSTLSGTEVGLEVRTFLPDVPILLTSGTPIEGWHVDDFSNLKTLMSGRVDFIQKPFTAQTLVSKIEKLLIGA
jgi:CheY-like chemotaxis protein